MFNNNDAPYGYKQADKGLVKDEYQEKVTKLIFELTAEGVSATEIQFLFQIFNILKSQRYEIDFPKLKQDMLALIKVRRAEFALISEENLFDPLMEDLMELIDRIETNQQQLTVEKVKEDLQELIQRYSEE